MSATVFLARHGAHAEVGHVLSGRSDIGLSQEGVSQARGLAALCGSAGISAVQTSPRARARQTGEIVASALRIEPEIIDDLDEIDFGAWTGRSFADLAGDERWQCWNSRRSLACPPGGEPMHRAARRIIRHLDSLAETGRSHVLCVSHCDVIRGAIVSYAGVGFDRMFEFEIEPGSLSSLMVDGGNARLVSLNQVPR